MKIVLLLIFLGLHHLNAQNKTLVYKDVDSLLASNSIINHMDALKLLDTKYIKDSVASNYWIYYAKACGELGKSSKTLRSIEKAIALDPKNDIAYWEKAKFYYDKEGDIPEALKLMNTALSITKKGEYYFYRGIYHQLSNLDERAKDDYEKAILLKHEEVGLYRNYAILLFKNDNPKKALEIINKAIALNPNDASNYITQGETYAFLFDLNNMCKSFATAYQKGYKKYNGFNETLCKKNNSNNQFALLGDLFYMSQKYNFAIEAYSKSILKNKDSSRFYLNRGYCYLKLKFYREAEKDLLHAATIYKAELDLIYDNLSLLYFEENNFEQSITYCNKRIALDAKNYTAILDRGLGYRKLKKYELAQKDFEQSLQIKPDFFRAYGYLSYLHLELNEHKKAFDAADKSISLNPEYGYGYLVRGQAKIALKQNDYCPDFELAKKYGNDEADKAIKAYCAK